MLILSFRFLFFSRNYNLILCDYLVNKQTVNRVVMAIRSSKRVGKPLFLRYIVMISLKRLPKKCRCGGSPASLPEKYVIMSNKLPYYTNTELDYVIHLDQIDRDLWCGMMGWRLFEEDPPEEKDEKESDNDNRSILTDQEIEVDLLRGLSVPFGCFFQRRTHVTHFIERISPVK